MHLISQLEEGGAQRQLSYVVSLTREYEVEVACLVASPPDMLFPYFRSTKIPVHYLSHSGDFYAPEILPALRKLCASKQYSLVHCWLYQSIVQGVIACRLESLPCIASPRSMMDRLNFGINKRWEKSLIRKTIRMADLALFPSQSAAVEYLDAGWVEPQRTRVVRNGVDVQSFVPEQGGTALIAVGRQSSEKAYDELEVIVQHLRKDFPQLRCLVAGGGRIRPEGNQIEYLGRIDDVRSVLKDAAVFISTSKTEGMSNALLEAQSMGIPGVVRNIGSNSEIIENGVNGFLAKTNDEFVNSCAALIRDDSLRKRMGENARLKAVNSFSIQTQVRKIELIYDELIFGKAI